jgi:large subunit ribosomal protein L9
LADEKKRVTQARFARQDKINQELATALAKIEITIEMQVGEEERLFGSVTTQDIQKALADQNIKIERHDIMLEEPIKALGVYSVPIKLASEIKPEIKLYVIKG